jgi:crossover junction endodeoxyribonuclease RuvC
LAFEIRLQELHRGICEVLSDHCPDLVAIEKLYSHRQRVTTAILLGHARGVIFLAVAQAGLRISAYEPTKVKKTLTGNGHASKTQVQKAVSLQLGLKTLPQPFDVSDALAIALCDFYRL